MNELYSWAMRNSAPILFGVAAVTLVIGIGQALVGFGSTVGNVTLNGEPVGQGAYQWLMFLEGTLRSATSAALPLAAAAALYRWDRRAITNDERKSR